MLTCVQFHCVKSGPHGFALAKYERTSWACEHVNRRCPTSFQHTTGVHACGNYTPEYALCDWCVVRDHNEHIFSSFALECESSEYLLLLIFCCFLIQMLALLAPSPLGGADCAYNVIFDCIVFLKFLLVWSRALTSNIDFDFWGTLFQQSI